MSKLTTKTLILSVATAATLAAIALPSLASADCYDRKQNAKTTGAVVGAVVGSNIAKSNTHCDYDRGYYGDRGYDRRGYDVAYDYRAHDDRRDYRDDRRDDRRDYHDDHRDDRNRDWHDDHH